MTAGDEAAPDAAVAFVDVQRVLGLFADGISGRPMQLEIAEGRRGWPFEASLPDVAAVRLPASIADFGTRAANRGAYRAAVLHQTGYAERGTFDVAPDPAVAHPHLWRRVYAILEDLRIDAATHRHYPGARADLRRVTAQALAMARAATPAVVDRREALVEALRLHSLGAPLADLVDEGRDAGDPTTLARIVRLASTVLDTDATATGSGRTATAVCELLDDELDIEGDAALAMTRPGDDPEEGSTEQLDDLPGPGDVPRPLSPDMKHHDTDGSRVGGVVAEVLTDDPGTPVDDEDPDDVRRAEPGRPGGGDHAGARTFRYDEWDYVRRTHLAAWCRVVERRLDGDDRSFIGDVRRRHAVLASRLRRQFAFMRPEGWVRVHRSDDGDELDLDAVIEAIVDRRTGHLADDRLHVRRDRALRDVATAFLVDLSASTGSPVVDEDAPVEVIEADEPEYRFAGIDALPLTLPLEPRRRVLDIAKESVALMCDALELLGDRHAVYGFSGEGRDNVEFHIAKDFDDRTSPSTWSAVAAMQPRRYTRMGPAIRHATSKLAVQPARTKLLIVISDGYPQDIDYGPDRADREYGLQDTARALQEAGEVGIASYCVTIDPAGHDYLRRMFADHHYLVIDDVPSLPRELAKLYGSLATSVTARGEG